MWVPRLSVLAGRRFGNSEELALDRAKYIAEVLLHETSRAPCRLSFQKAGLRCNEVDESVQGLETK